MRLIKKYRNRRLYDTKLRKTISFSDIKSYVVNDIDFKVIDNATGRDITISVLSNIISRSGANLGRSGLKILNTILMKGGIGAVDILKKLTLASIGAVNITREKIEEIFDEMVKRGEMTSDEKAQAVKNFVDRSVESTAKMRERMEDIASRISEKLSARVSDQVSGLAAKIEELSAKVAKIEKKLSKN